MSYHIVSKKNMLLKCVVLGLYFLSMNSVWPKTFFERMATKTHADDPKTSKILRLKKFDDIPEFKDISANPADKAGWDGFCDKIKETVDEFFRLKRELSTLKKFSSQYLTQMTKVMSIKNDYVRFFGQAKNLFSKKIFKKIIAKKGFDEVATTSDVIKNKYKGWSKIMRVVKYFDDIPEFKEIDVNDAAKKSWNRICGDVRQNAKTLNIDLYNKGFEEAEALFKKILE